MSRGEVVPGLRSVAAPVLGPDGGARAALAVVYVDDTADVDWIGGAVADAAGKVTAALR
jgi:DNA-binding IclR family transcriptional regulator